MDARGENKKILSVSSLEHSRLWTFLSLVLHYSGFQSAVRYVVTAGEKCSMGQSLQADVLRPLHPMTLHATSGVPAEKCKQKATPRNLSNLRIAPSAVSTIAYGRLTFRGSVDQLPSMNQNVNLRISTKIGSQRFAAQPCRNACMVSTSGLGHGWLSSMAP